MDARTQCSSDGSSATDYVGSDMHGLLTEKHVRRSYTLSRTRRAIRDPWVALPWMIALVSICVAAYFNYQLRAQLQKAVELPYSPANHLIRYERRPFVLGFGDDMTEYEAKPSPELDAKWDDLYSMGIVAVSQEQASHLEEKTQPLPDDPDNRYVLGMNVFHDLHCLNMLRKHLLPEYYPEHRNASSTEDGFMHIMHCVDALRQSIMCNVDLSIIPFQVGDHMCRNFEVVQDWAREHAMADEWDHEYRPVNDPLDSDTWAPGWHPLGAVASQVPVAAKHIEGASPMPLARKGTDR
ncbi:Cyclochlorotine biosynthesis protein O [Apiospora marii]|uniref:Cyclochlorotine biosynthesis protein O n=1 Tax=Apiospora marii TaxID=335849 RepID=A0ABR1SRG0_9PEZI